MLCCGVPLSATGGHGDLNGMAPGVRIDGVASDIADGPDAIRKTIRNNVKYGADWIKILASAGVLSEEESVGRPQYSEEEMKAAVDEAAVCGPQVRRAHAHGSGVHQDGGASRRTNPSSIAASWTTRASQLMKQHDAWLVPTIYCVDYVDF